MSSAARPPRATTSWARACERVRKALSSPPIHVTPPAGPRGTIVTCTGSLAWGRVSAATVWPAKLSTSSVPGVVTSTGGVANSVVAETALPLAGPMGLMVSTPAKAAIDHVPTMARLQVKV